MSAVYAEAAIPEPFRILGLKLKPFCLGHYLLMGRFECAFVSDTTANAKREDLILGILICSMTYEEFLAFIERADFKKQVKAWGKKIGIFDFPSKAKLFLEYLEKGTKEPDYVVEEEDGAQSGGHWSQAVLTSLTGHLGYTRTEALNAPLTQAFADFYKHAEGMGVVRLMDPAELENAEVIA